ncbi:MAG: hypothetical protein ISR69_13535 [Gammaproteobacteria bacterium]|nr:hypothetical protein [Gammaproteobacteria bacterium]
MSETIKKNTAPQYTNTFPNAAYIEHINHEDEINLVDLWITLREYKSTFSKYFITFILIGFLISVFSHKKVFDLITTIQIGSIEQNGQIIPIESAESLQAKITKSIAPNFILKWAEKNNYDKPIDIETKIEKDSNIISLPKSSDRDLSLLLSS